MAGTYAWYLTQLPAAIDTTRCISWAGLTLLYVRQHYALNAYGSTLRLTLGCLLADRLGLVLRRVGSGTRLTFADGEARLSQWMADNAFVCWVARERAVGA